MNSWFSKKLGDAISVADKLEEIRATFLSLYNEGKHQKKSVYFRHESDGRLHCEVCVYFSPNAEQLALLFHAKPCDKPSSNSLDILVGSKCL